MSVWAAMSGSLAAIFSLLGSKKWIIRDGVTGISRSGSGAPMACGLKKSLGCLMAPEATYLRAAATARMKPLAGSRKPTPIREIA